MSNEVDKKRKKLLYLSSNRGTKEADIIIGGFIKKAIYISNLNDLSVFERFLQESDFDILDWLINNDRDKIPLEYKEIIIKYNN